jgi:hypothetical protein
MAKAKFDIRNEATRPLYAGVGVTDLAVARLREYVADVQKKFVDVQKDVQKSVTDLDLQPKAIRDQATTVVSARVDALTKDAKARRAAIEARVAELQEEAKAYPARVQALLTDNVSTATGTYDELVKRGETLVGRIRRQQSTQRTASSAKTTTAKAKTTTTQAKKTTKKATSTAKKTAKKSPAKSSAKATATAAKKTASNAAQAAGDAAQKVGD